MALRVGKYEIRRYNELNLRAYEFKTPKVKGFRKEAGEPKWIPLDAYFGNVDAALAWLYDRLLMDGIEERDMDAAAMLAECRRVRDELLAAREGNE